MIKKVILTTTCVLALFFICFAAELDGKWTGKLAGPDGNEFPVSYNLKVEGSSVSGTVSIPDSDLPISDGKIEGQKFSFNVSFQGVTYLNEGELTGDTLKIKVHFGEQVVESFLTRSTE